MLKFEQTSRIRGDETSSYSVTVQRENVTLREFINYILTERKGEWGYIGIQRAGEPWHSPSYQIEYRWGEIVADNIPDDIKDRIIPSKIFGDGGWSRMDYVIKLGDLI